MSLYKTVIEMAYDPFTPFYAMLRESDIVNDMFNDMAQFWA